MINIDKPPVRIIARLDIKGSNLVKGISLEGLRVMGKPEEFAEYYYENDIDELFYMDVVASLYERNGLKEIIKSIAKKVFVPITVGGGIRTINDINSVLRCGADKVCINTAAIKNPEFIKQASLMFGSSTIVIAIEAIKQADGSYLAYTDNGREFTGVEVSNWAKKVVELGAGEIVITSVDMEGTGKGFDIELINLVCNNVDVPVISHGGVGKKEDLKNLFQSTSSNAAAIASILHYNNLQQKTIFSTNNFSEGNIDFLKSGNKYSNIQPCSIEEIKKYLISNKINCRYKNRD